MFWCLNWYIDINFGVYVNMRGNAEGAFTMGRGFPIVRFMKHKVIMQSSTESELAGAVDMMPLFIWTWYFSKAQG